MDRIQMAFEKARAQGRPCFIPYLTCGLPSPDATVELSTCLLGLGAGILELGLPFSDPIADGPILQKASHLALKRGVNTDLLFQCAKKIRDRSEEIGLVVMSYLNPIFQYGIERFFAWARDSGIDGVIVPDCPLEETGLWIRHAYHYNIAPIMLCTPTTKNHRVLDILKVCRGFLYYVSSKGVTGPRKALPGDLIERLRPIKALSPLPVAVGFGISKKHHLDLLSPHVDGIVIGSFIMDIIINNRGELMTRLSNALEQILRIRE